jgi:uroporphyrinogen-III synthase
MDLTPEEYRAEGMLQAMAHFGGLEGARILLPRADIGREVVGDELRKHGAEVTEVVAYRTIAVEAEREGEPDIYRMLLDRRIDVVTFTSPSAVRNFVRLVGAEPAADLLRSTTVASIGPVTAEAASQFNIHSGIVPAEFTVPALVNAIGAYFQQPRETPEAAS